VSATEARHPCHRRALIQGVPEREVGAEALELLRRVGLPGEMALRAAHTYSGGNKRKLSLAIALAGRPAAVLLDEPSSGAQGVRKQGPKREGGCAHPRALAASATAACH
jgi:ABC-type glutathione transport system ATPase component